MGGRRYQSQHNSPPTNHLFLINPTPPITFDYIIYEQSLKIGYCLENVEFTVLFNVIYKTMILFFCDLPNRIYCKNSCSMNSKDINKTNLQNMI